MNKNKNANKVLKWLEIRESERVRVSEGDIALPRYNFQRLIGVTWSRCRHCYCCYYCCCGQSPCHHLLIVSPFDCWHWLGQTIRFRPLLDKLYPLLVQLYQLYANFYFWLFFLLFIHAIIICLNFKRDGRDFGMMKRYWKRVEESERERECVGERDREREREKSGSDRIYIYIWEVVERDEFENEIIDFYG